MSIVLFNYVMKYHYLPRIHPTYFTFPHKHHCSYITRILLSQAQRHQCPGHTRLGGLRWLEFPAFQCYLGPHQDHPENIQWKATMLSMQMYIFESSPTQSSPSQEVAIFKLQFKGLYMSMSKILLQLK